MTTCAVVERTGKAKRVSLPTIDGNVAETPLAARKENDRPAGTMHIALFERAIPDRNKTRINHNKRVDRVYG